MRITNVYVIFLICSLICFKVEAKNVDSLKTAKNQSSNYDKRFEDLQSQLEKSNDNINSSISANKQDLKDMLNIYVWCICGIFTLIAFAINFLGKKAIKERVEEIIAETAKNHVDAAVLTLINSKITTELIAELIKDKSDKELSELLKNIKNKGDHTIDAFRQKGNEVLNLMIAAPSKSINKLEGHATDEEINQFNDVIRSEEFFNMAYATKDPKISIELYKNVIELEPNSYGAYNNIGVAYNNSNKYEQAISYLNKCIEINPNYGIAFSNRALAHNQLGRLFEALNDAHKAIELNGVDELAYAVIGNVLTKQNKFIEAEEALNTAINLNPNSPEALFNRAFFFEERNLYEKSEQDYLAAEKYGLPNKALLYNNMAVLYRRQRRFPEAMEYIRKAREHDPSFPNLDGTLALIYADQKKDEEFYKHIKIALEKGCQVWNYLGDYGFDRYRNSQRLLKLIETFKKIS